MAATIVIFLAYPDCDTPGAQARAYQTGRAHGRAQMSRLITIVSVLIIVALGSTVIALALQSYFGRLPFLALLGPVLAAVAATILALRVRKK